MLVELHNLIFFTLNILLRSRHLRHKSYIYLDLGQNEVFLAMEGLGILAMQSYNRMRSHTRTRHGTPACYNMRDKSRAVGIAD